MYIIYIGSMYNLDNMRIAGLFNFKQDALDFADSYGLSRAHYGSALQCWIYGGMDEVAEDEDTYIEMYAVSEYGELIGRYGEVSEEKHNADGSWYMSPVYI